MVSSTSLLCPRLKILSAKFAEIRGEGNTVQVLAAITSSILTDVKHQKSHHIQCDNQHEAHDNLNLLPSPVELTKRHVWKKDKGEQEPEQEPYHVSEVVHVR